MFNLVVVLTLILSQVTFKTTQLVATGKPFFIVVQAFGGGELWERNPTPAVSLEREIQT